MFVFPKTLQDPDLIDPSDPRWLLLRRVVDGATFGKSPRLRDFLLYIGRKTIENRLEDVREQTIGQQVFDRRPEYSPGEDNIVRVEARQLRKRLELFFATEGADETLVITIPKGAYVPHFGPRESASELQLAHTSQHPEIETLPIDVLASIDPKPSVPHRYSVHPALLLILIVMALAGSVVSIILRGRYAHRPTAHGIHATPSGLLYLTSAWRPT